MGEANTPMNDDTEMRVNVGILMSKMEGIEKTLESMNNTLLNNAGVYVSRNEWLQRNTTVEDKFNGHGREIGEIRTELKARQTPWHSVASILVASAALAWVILGPVITGN